MNKGFSNILIAIVVALFVVGIGGYTFILQQSSTQKTALESPSKPSVQQDNEEMDRLNSPTQAVPAPGFEDVPEMIVSKENNITEPEPESESLPSQSEDSDELRESPNSPEEIGKIVVWDNLENGWEPSATPPACPKPLQLVTPTDLTLVTSVLYPGQYRSDNYKPHGGFRYDNSLSDDITIIAPMDARVVDGNRSLWKEQSELIRQS